MGAIGARDCSPHREYAVPGDRNLAHRIAQVYYARLPPFRRPARGVANPVVARTLLPRAGKHAAGSEQKTLGTYRAAGYLLPGRQVLGAGSDQFRENALALQQGL